MQLAAATLAGVIAAPAETGPINTAAIFEAAIKYILPLLILAIGLAIVLKANGHGQTRQIFSMVSQAVIGCIVIASAGAFFVFASALAKLIFPS